MPKKFKQHDLAQQYNSTARSQATLASASTAGSVNEKLERSRKAQLLADRDRYQKLRDQAETIRSVPPDVGSLLGAPRIAPPKARNRRIRIPARTPGPPPPNSWLEKDIDAKAATARTSPRGGRARSLTWNSVCHTAPLSRFTTLLGYDSVGPRSLTHCILREIALSYSQVVKTDPDLARYMPGRIIAALPSYLQVYSPLCNITRADLPVLACHSLDSPFTLDLAGLVGPQLTVRDVARLLKRQRFDKGKVDQYADGLGPADSWEDEYCQTSHSIPHSPSHSLGGALTRLSLSHPLASVSWPDLLLLTSHTPGLSFLSLAFWPYPAWSSFPVLYEDLRVPHHDCHVRLMSKRLPEDTREARSIIRRLSINTFNLQWLDLEGCEDWWQELVEGCDGWPSAQTSGKGEFRYPAVSPENWPSKEDVADGTACADWASSWRQVVYLRLTQSRTLHAWPFGIPSFYTPDAAPTEEALDTDDHCRREISKSERMLGSGRRFVQRVADATSRRGLSATEADIWMGKELAARNVARRCQRARRHGADGKQLEPMVVDFGWPTADLGYAGTVTEPVSRG